MSLRCTFRPAELAELRRRLDRLRWREPEHWLDDFPELWLARGVSWHRHDSENALPWAETADGEHCSHLFEALHAEVGAWSYLCTSFLHRVLSRPSIRGVELWLAAPPPAELLRSIRRPEDIPADWRPSVIEDNTRVTVRWYAVAGSELYEHADVYRREGFDFESTRRLLARSGGC